MKKSPHRNPRQPRSAAAVPSVPHSRQTRVWSTGPGDDMVGRWQVDAQPPLALRLVWTATRYCIFGALGRVRTARGSAAHEAAPRRRGSDRARRWLRSAAALRRRRPEFRDRADRAVPDELVLVGLVVVREIASPAALGGRSTVSPALDANKCMTDRPGRRHDHTMVSDGAGRHWPFGWSEGNLARRKTRSAGRPR